MNLLNSIQKGVTKFLLVAIHQDFSIDITVREFKIQLRLSLKRFKFVPRWFSLILRFLRFGFSFDLIARIICVEKVTISAREVYLDVVVEYVSLLDIKLVNRLSRFLRSLINTPQVFNAHYVSEIYGGLELLHCSVDLLIHFLVLR